MTNRIWDDAQENLGYAITDQWEPTQLNQQNLQISKFLDTFSRMVYSIVFFFLPSVKRPTLKKKKKKKKDLFSTGAKFFPFRIDTFQKPQGVQETKK